jgi:hypothetical protein
MERKKHAFEVNLLPFLVGFQHVFKRTISTGDPKVDFEGYCFSGFMVEIKNEWIFVTAGHCLKHLAKLLDSSYYEPHSFRFMEFLHPEDHSDTSVPVALDNGWMLFQDELDIDYGFFRFSFLVRQCLEQRGVKAFSLENIRFAEKRGFASDHTFLLGLPESSTRLDKDAAAFRFGPMLYEIKDVEIDEHILKATIDTEESIVGMSGGPIIGTHFEKDGDVTNGVLFPIAVQSKWNGKDRVTAHRIDCVANIILERYFTDPNEVENAE